MNTHIHEINKGLKLMTNEELVQLIRVGVQQVVEELVAKIEVLENKVEYLHQGMGIFNMNFQNIGQTLGKFDKRIEEVESQAIPTPINETRH